MRGNQSRSVARESGGLVNKLFFVSSDGIVQWMGRRGGLGRGRKNLIYLTILELDDVVV
jgi:hypothetical protein